MNPVTEAATAYAEAAAKDQKDIPLALALRLAFAEGALFGARHIDSSIEAAQAIAIARTPA
jgi:hypothetical protein